MKKLLLFLFLMTISLGQSQTLVGTWKVTSVSVGGSQQQDPFYFGITASSGARACFFDDEYVFDADGDFHNVQQGSTFLEGWQGGGDACGTPVAPHDGSNAATYSSTATTLTLTGVGAHLGLPKAINGSEISSPSAAPASITYQYTLTSTTLTVDVAVGANWWRFVLSNEVVAPPPPVTAPTVAANTPTQSAEDAISIFSGAYTNVGVSTFRTSWSSVADQETVSVDGNSTLKYTALNYAGIDINPANQINATSMETFHIDMWTPDCTTFKVKLVDFGANGVYGGGDDKEHEVTRTPIQNGWNYFDISLSDFTELTTRANINQLVLSSSGGAVYIDNMYFWKLPSGSSSYYVDADGDGYGAGTATVSSTPIAGSVTNSTDCNDANNAIYPGATEVADTVDNDCDGLIDEGFPPTVAAPTPPTRNAWDVVSIFSGAYSNVALDELPTGWSQLGTAPFSVESIGGNDTWKFGGEFLGMAKYSGDGVNLTDMTMVHIDYWTPDPNLIILKLVNTVDGGDGTAILEDPTVSGSWRSRDIPLSMFGALNRSKITQLLIDPQSGGSTVYVDNFYFYRPETGAPSPSIGALTVPAKVIGDANFELTAPSSNSAGAFTYTSSNESVATISGTTVTIVGAGSSIITATQAAAGSYGAGSTQATLVVSLNVAAPTPTIPADRVLSVYSGATAYGTLANTNFYPNWGQATQYAQVDVVGNPTLRYSNLNYQGIQLGSILDITSYDSIHLDIYGAGTSSLNFRVINQVGGAGSTDVERIAATQITLNPGWNSVVIPVSSLTTATPGFELNRVGQLAFVGSGTIYVDNIFFSKAVPTTVAPTVANIAFCKGSASALTAVASGTNALKWYTAATGGTALASAPTPTATKTYYVSQVMSSGTESSRAMIVATINNLPATPSALTSLESKKICKYIDSDTPVLFSATAEGASSYIWTTTINNITEEDITNDGAEAFISFKNVSKTPGAIGSVKVQIQDANGCISLPRALALTTAVPTAPTSLVMTSANSTPHFKGIITPAVEEPATPAVYGLVGLNSLVKITKVGPYMGTETVFTLTAAEAPTAASYEWTLNGATQLTGGNGRIITVDFAGVEPGIGSLPIVVKSVGGCGSSTARTLTLARVVPTAPTKLVLTEGNSETAITKVGAYTGKSTPLTLTATPFTTQGGTATSYAWILPAGVNCLTGNTATTVKVKSTVNTGTIEVPVYLFDDVAAIATASSTITINLNNVAEGILSIPLKVFAVNGAGNSIARTLALTAAVPATPSIVATGGTTFTSCATKTYTATSTSTGITSYTWTIPAGASFVGASNGNVIVVDYAATSVTTGTTGAVTCYATNGTGNSVTKSLTVKRVACPVRLSDSSANAFSVIAYPNPSSSEFTIESSAKGAMSVKVYDMQGRLVEKAQSNRVGSKLAAGTYNVIVNQGANTKSVRVIKN